MLDLFANLEFHVALMLVVALLFVLIYEIINGFHDTANAVVTVIYTRALRLQLALVMSGICNFLGVIMGGLSVAYSIVHLFPTNLLLNVSFSHGLTMMFSMLLATILWNLGTWYFGLPTSSSHALIGAIIGIGLTNAFVTNNSVVEALNTSKLIEIFISLIISPIVGFLLASIMIFILRRYWSKTKKRRRIHLMPMEREKQDGKRKPPFWTRIMLILSAAGVNFAHGANDGQKGIGLIMLILISVTPSGFVVNMSASGYDISRTSDAMNHLRKYYTQHHNIFIHLLNFDKQMTSVSSIPNILRDVPLANNQILTDQEKAATKILHYNLSRALVAINRASLLLNNLESYHQLNSEQRSQIRCLLMCIADTADRITKLPEISSIDKRFLTDLRRDLLYTVEYAPTWIIVVVALALALGTMIGWRRISATLGEKIGKTTGITYAQGLVAQLTAAVSISFASYTGMPVSTTHVLSSAVTGTMLIDGGGVQGKTVKNILIAWVLTLPVVIVLAGSFYWFALKLI